MKRYRLVIIGAGSAGLSAAEFAAGLGLGGLLWLSRKMCWAVNACIRDASRARL